MKKILSIIIIGLISFSVFSQNDITMQLKAEYESEKYDQIISEHSQKANEYPAKAIFYIGMAYHMKADDNSCLKFMNMSIEKDDSDSDAYFIRGVTFNYLGQFDKAIESFDIAISLDSSNSNYYSGLGDSYFSKEQLNKALVAYEEATKKENAIDRPFTMIPLIYDAQNQPVKALESFYSAKSNISQESESYITALYNIGLYEILNKNYEKAELAFVELIELAPNDFSSYSKLIQVYYGKKEYKKAEPYRQKLYDAYDKGILKDNLKDMFCFDQFDWNDKLIQVFERFEVKEGELYYKHLFYVVNNQNQIEYRIQTENSPVSIELGGTKYVLGMDKDGTHSTFGFGFNEGFKYDDLKNAVVKILEEEVRPAASSRPSKRNKK